MDRTNVRRRRRALTAGAAVIAVLGALRFPLARADADHACPCVHRYVVRSGDTVWGIAVRFGHGGDPRPLSDSIESVNHLRSDELAPGQTLVIPAM